MPSIFLSHSSKDKFFVRELAERLTGYGVRVWLDEVELNVGDSLTRRIGEAVDEADFVGAVLSSNSVKSEWVQRELEIALHKEIKGRKVVILPILIEPVEIPPFLKDKLYADFTAPGDFDKSLGAVLRALGVRATPPPDPVSTGAQHEKPSAHSHPPIAPRATELEMFEDIAIVELDANRTHNPDPSRSLYNVYFRLSSSPSMEWSQIFDAERRFPRHSMWRRAWVDGAYLVVQCPLEEIAKYHHRDLKQDVESANSKLRQFLTEQARQEAHKQHAQTAEREKILAIKNNLPM